MIENFINEVFPMLVVWEACAAFSAMMTANEGRGLTWSMAFSYLQVPPAAVIGGWVALQMLGG